ncbi:MAG: glycosyltransferase family 4 protein [bacterium]|nr:glycosyltransferase family 4 protein [bacterium]
MHIVMLQRFDIYTVPGTVRMINLATQFVSQGHQVTLCYYPDFMRRKAYPPIRKTDPVGIDIIPLEPSKLALFRNIRTVCRLAKSADIIHFQKCFPDAALPALFAAYLYDKPVHYDWDDRESALATDWSQSKLVKFALIIYEWLIPKLVDTITVSTEMIRNLAVRYGIKSDRIFAAPVGADITLFNPEVDGSRIKQKYNLGSPVIIYHGQMDLGTYADQLVHAAPLVLEKFPTTQFLIVGGGDKLPQLKQLAEKLQITPHMIFTDYVHQEAIPEYIAAADIAVACFEDNEITHGKSPLKIAEYLAMGKPIVASRVGDIPNMLGNAGILVNPNDVKALSGGIIELLNNPDTMAELGKQARLRAEQIYNWTKIANTFLSAYELGRKKYEGQSTNQFST